MSQVETAIELQSEELFRQLPLTEIRVVGQFRDDIDRAEVLQTLAGIAGGVSCSQLMGGYVVSVCVEEPHEVAQVRAAIAECANRTEQGFLNLVLRQAPISMALPILRNPDPRGKRGKLFPRHQRRSVVAKLKRELGTPQVFQSEGLWKSDQGEIIPDLSEVLVFPANDARIGDAIKAIRSVILGHPACDQQCIFLSCGGRATCVYRTEEAAGTGLAVAS